MDACIFHCDAATRGLVHLLRGEPWPRLWHSLGMHDMCELL